MKRVFDVECSAPGAWKQTQIKQRNNIVKRNSFTQLFVSMALVISMSFSLLATPGGDRNEHGGFSFAYPDASYWHNGTEGDPQRGRVFDITKPPYNAIPDDGLDDTEAFIQAYDDIMDSFRYPGNYIPGFLMHFYEDITRIIYIPNGTYDISNTIIYRGDIIYKGGGQECIHGVRFVGQSRKGVILRLKENTFTAEGDYRPVISFGKLIVNDSLAQVANAVASNFVRNLTIAIGPGNSKAIGIRFNGANVAAINNVDIISEDGQGRSGLDFIYGASQGYFADITVKGFDHGIRAFNWYASHSTFEHITLQNQNVSGFVMGDASASVRDLLSINSVPGVEFAYPDGQLTLISSELKGGEGGSAIAMPYGHLTARDIEAKGYDQVLDGLPGTYITEYVSDGVQTLFDGQVEQSLNLDVEDVIPPYVTAGKGKDADAELALHYDDPATWVSVNSFGAPSVNHDDPVQMFGPGDATDAEKIAHYAQWSQDNDASAGIQAAMNSGASTVYFLPGNYVINQTVYIPSAVTRVNLMFSKLKRGENLDENTPAFRIMGEAGDAPLVIEDHYGFMTYMGRYDTPYDNVVRNTSDVGGTHTWYEHASQRTLVLQNSIHMRSAVYNNTVPGGKVFIYNTSAKQSRASGCDAGILLRFNGQKVWCRHVNPEFEESGLVRNSGGNLWILGYKVEQKYEAVDMVNDNGGKLEVLGGFLNWTGRTDKALTPHLLNDNSSASITYRAHWTRWGWGGDFSVRPRFFVTEIRGMEARDIFYEQEGDLPIGHRGQPILPLYAGY